MNLPPLDESGALPPAAPCVTPKRCTLRLILLAATLFAADYAAEGSSGGPYPISGRRSARRPQHRHARVSGRLSAYVEAQFEKLGLKPAGASGYLQPVRFETRQIAGIDAWNSSATASPSRSRRQEATARTAATSRPLSRRPWSLSDTGW